MDQNWSTFMKKNDSNSPLSALFNSFRFVHRAFLRLYSFWLGGAVTLGPSDQKVALTFDDGPDDRWTPQILEILAEHRARATFFMLGAQIEKHPAVAGAVASRGHELAVHLFSHDPKAADDDALFRSELVRTKELICGITGAQPLFLRFPFAYLGRQKPRRILDELEMHTVHWSFSSMDSRLDAAGIEKRVERFLMPGAIVLLHDGVGMSSKYASSRQATVDALPGVLDLCRENALAPTALSEMLFKQGMETR
jgi:peptidoglycan/xylan/chitin deacetylase (PgdA/CDA1 family)